MAMVPCRECGGSVSSEAALCPHCGIREPAGAGVGHQGHDRPHGVPVRDSRDHAPVRRRGGKTGWMVAFLLLLVLLALFALWYTDIVNFT
ncbi:MAG: hypothetical protein AVDCRST_MAG89-3827 [uncultured Gemmatimonadetes bacterium]|uniref:Zinc-ribbon domain-containing protein n=1 Tax=uncultured Gemmatimonadota bacterium TaxID=203437 RepID=A0A6J4MR84_9BACT|nr:MAG: hypothetical protein AVDCRST_MAG89-3827 [uncultured Gemmatimonadota bacterium]